MSSLRELQYAIRRSLVAQSSAEAAAAIIADGLLPEARLNIYRNTFVGTLTTALRLSFPVVHRLVGAEFFEGTAGIFAAKYPPRSAYLNDYGAAFPAFLAEFAPAAALPYLPDVARLEWAVNRALHAPDVEPLDLLRLRTIDPADQGRIAFIPHPSIALVRSNYPVDTVWRAVIEQDEASMADIDLESDTVWLLTERLEDGIRVGRCSEQAWRFAAALLAGVPLQFAIDTARDVNASLLLADHLARGHFTDFNVVDLNDGGTPEAT